MLSNQPINTNQTSQPAKTLEQTSPSIIVETTCQQSPSEGVTKEQTILNLAKAGWHFRIKKVNGKNYLTARNFKERSFGILDKETKALIEKHNIAVNGLNNNNQPANNT